MKKIFYKIKYSLGTLFKPPFTIKKIVKIILLILVLVLLSNFMTKDKAPVESETASTPIVFVGTVADVQKSSGASFVGTVRAVSEAQIQSETSGRVTAVSVAPGDTVVAGTILASLENASEQASLLQAQGGYEAALAGAAQSEITVDSALNALLTAQNNAINTYRNTYSTGNAAVLNDIDVFFRNPTGYNIIGLKINSYGNSDYLREKRKALRSILPEWRETSNSLVATSDLVSVLSEARENTQLLIDMTDVLINITSRADKDDTLEGLPVTGYTSGLTSTRLTLNNILNSISTAETSLSTAEENLRRAQIGATQNTEASLANAQVKQALGALRSAQAMYEKTIFRTPISGTVNNINLNVGDFVNSFTQVAEVANNDALEISIFVGENDLVNFSIGNEVIIDNKVTGVVTSVSPAIDSVTQKTEVKIATESVELTNGSTVTIKVDTSIQTEDNTSPLYIPITAIKFEAKNGVIFTVEDNALTPQPVTIGTIQGTSVEIIDGITRDTVFVIDARGFAEGQKVEAVRNEK